MHAFWNLILKKVQDKAVAVMSIFFSSLPLALVGLWVGGLPKLTALPVCLPTVFDIFIYLFCNAMTTVSGVIFLYSYDTTLASVSSTHLDEQGDVAGAAAMAMLIVYISFLVRGIHTIVSTFLMKRT